MLFCLLFIYVVRKLTFLYQLLVFNCLCIVQIKLLITLRPSARLRRLLGFPVMPTVDLHALLSLSTKRLTLLKVEPFVGVRQESSLCLASVSGRYIAQKLGREQNSSFLRPFPTFSTNSRGNAFYAGW